MAPAFGNETKLKNFLRLSHLLKKIGPINNDHGVYATLNPSMAQNGSPKPGTLKRTIHKIGHKKDTEEGIEKLVVEEYVKKFDNEKDPEPEDLTNF